MTGLTVFDTLGAAAGLAAFVHCLMRAARRRRIHRAHRRTLHRIGLLP